MLMWEFLLSDVPQTVGRWTPTFPSLLLPSSSILLRVWRDILQKLKYYHRYFQIHHVHIKPQWSPCFTYPLIPFCWSCFRPPAHYFGVSFIMVSLLYDLWSVEAYKCIIYLSQVDISLSIQKILQFHQKGIFYHCMGGNWWIYVQ